MAQPPKKRTRQPAKQPRQPSANPPAAQATAPEEHHAPPASSAAAFPIVGIGASAGGLEAFTQLLQQIPVATGLTFVLMQHLDPTHESMLPDLLSRVTKMPVQQVRTGMDVEPNHIYVAPPNVSMTMNGLVLKLASRSETHRLHMPIDHFFRSLAREHGSRAIGIILSGAGSDGALGLAEIKEQGGITFVQDERTAKFPGMPHSAITNGGIDFILSPAGIAQELARVAQHPYVISPPSGREEEAPAEPPPVLQEIALAKARSGRYIENIALDISPARLRGFFTKTDQRYQIMPAIRELCTFARHDLCRDPPFSNLDLISCRNVLIYLDTAMQKRVIQLFHYALNPSGFPALGVSESIGGFTDLFTLVDKKQKIFSRKVAVARPSFDFSFPMHAADNAVAADPVMSINGPLLTGVDIYHEADRVVLNHYSPAGVVINEQMDILQFRGDTSHFLRLAPGRASLNVLQMARDGLLMDLRSAITQAQRTGGSINRDGVQVRFDGKSLNVTIRVIPLTLPSPLAPHYVVLFEEVTLPAGREVRRRTQRMEPAKQEADTQQISQLAQELEASRQYLQSIIERYETANEELKSANEEILSSNEELQSTNEELETAKEELQSTNEELSTVNDELRQRNHELGEANNDLSNLFSSANLPIIVLSSDLRIRRFTAAAEKVLNIIPTDIGRPIGHLNLNIHVPNLEPLILEAIDSMSIIEREVQDPEGHWYCLRIRPHRTTDNRIDGAMLLCIDIDSFKDVDRLTSLLAEVDTARQFAEGVVERAPWPLLILDPHLRVIKANPAFYQVFRTSPAQTEQQFIYTLGSGQWNIPELQRLLEDVIPHHSEFHNFEVTHDFPQLGERTVLLNARCIRRDEQETDTILLGIEDITEFRQMAERTAAALRDKEVLLREIHHRVKNNLQIISSLLSLQAGAIEDQTIRELFQESQRRIKAMSLVHQKLYGAEDLARTNTRTYIQNLTEDLARMYDTEGRIAFDIHADGELDIDSAIPCGLILTELVSNALKYAFPTGRRGNVSVTLRPEAEDRWILSVQDNGIGIPPEIDIAHSDSLGLNLVHDLASQLGGRVELDRSQGTTFTLHFIPVQLGRG